ncbi:MAG TPA: YibE/F family protein [Candidatus Paceibacterota bacterium]|nr:YibE/F family protein [Candidatus Paceibacterota bacterium]
MRENVARINSIVSLAVILFTCTLALPLFAHAQDASTTGADAVFVAQALITNVVSDTITEGATDTAEGYSEIVAARILNGAERGQTIEYQISGTVGDGQNVRKGDIMYVTRYLDTDSDPMATVYTYNSIDHYRLPALAFFVILFLGCVVFIGGKQGIRGLITLAGVICLIIFVLLPGILHGYSALALSVFVASLIASIGAYVTHGFSKMTSSAVLGMILTILIATFLADIAVHTAYLSGITDESTYDLLNTPGYADVNFQGLLLGAMIIGLLGVLYDAAIGQAVAVEELARAAPHLPRVTIYTRAFRIGREHIGALMNTLVLAYVGTSLPIFLMYSGVSLFSSTYYSPVINQEWLATEILRTVIGGIGLMLTIPITTFIAVWILVRRREAGNAQTLAEEKAVIDRISHSHVHTHDTPQ